MEKHGGVVHGSGGQSARGVQEIAPVVDRSEWTKFTDMVTTMWAILRADDLKPPFSSVKDVLVLTAMAFELNKKTTEGIANAGRTGPTGVSIHECW